MIYDRFVENLNADNRKSQIISNFLKIAFMLTVLKCCLSASIHKLARRNSLRNVNNRRIFNQHQMLVNDQNLVIVLSGATSVGKSAVARELCKLYDAEIVIADSVQVYKNLDIGSN